MDDMVCPFCGAETMYEYVSIGSMAVHKQYLCGTRLFNDGTYLRKDDCKDRQIAQLTERLEAWRKYAVSLEDYVEWFENMAEFVITFEDSSKVINYYNKLKALGEI